MKRFFCTALILLLAILLCAALFSCRKKPADDNPKKDPAKEDVNQPESPAEEDPSNPKKDGDTYRY